MTLIYAEWLPLVIIALLIICYLIYRKEKKFFSWVFLYWFYQRTLASKLSTFFFFLSIVLFSSALLDVRGPEVRIEMEIPEQKTILLIDASASMLTEDVRPNRFNRGLFLARHFARTAIGHQISVIIFSDISKRVVSFTNDIDLLDARLTGLDKIDIANGGSNITGALHEAIKYFHEGSGQGPLTGNLVVITDGEENVESLKMDIPEGIALAVIGIGTAQGGFIPMRSQDGTFRGYRRYNGENVVSKLNEDWFKSFAGSHRSYKYWVAQSYTVPTEEILGFFSKIYNRRMSEGEIRFRPVWGLPLIAMGLLSLLLSSLLGLRKTFIKQSPTFVLLICLFFLHVPVLLAAEDPPPPEPSAESVRLLSMMQKGELRGHEKFLLAENLYKDGLLDQALVLYKEIFNKEPKAKYKESWKNYAFLLLSQGETSLAAKELKDLFDTITDKKELEDLRTNVILILQKEGDQKGDGDGEGEESPEEKEDQENEDENESQGENKDKSDKESDSSEGGDTSEQESDKNEQEKEDEKENEEQPEEGSEQETEEKKAEPQTWDAKVKDIKQQLRTKEQLPAILKQIMDADSEVQQQELDTRTTDPSSGNDKDW